MLASSARQQTVRWRPSTEPTANHETAPVALRVEPAVHSDVHDDSTWCALEQLAKAHQMTVSTSVLTAQIAARSNGLYPGPFGRRHVQVLQQQSARVGEQVGNQHLDAAPIQHRVQLTVAARADRDQLGPVPDQLRPLPVAGGAIHARGSRPIRRSPPMSVASRTSLLTRGTRTL